MSDKAIRSMVKDAGVRAELADILIARREDIIRRIEALKRGSSYEADLKTIKEYMGHGYQDYVRSWQNSGVLNEAEYVITKGYTGNGYYRDINGTLVKMGGETYNQGFRYLDQDTIEAIRRQIDSALDKLPKPKENVVWRGVQLDPNYVQAKFIPGRTCRLLGYQSTSVNRQSSYTGLNTLFEIRLTRKQGGMVETISDYPSENEFLLKADLQFKVLSVQQSGWNYYIVLEEI